MIKIAIISDIHCMEKFFDNIVSKFNEYGITHVFFAGDYVTDGFANNSIIEKIRYLKDKYNGIVIAGNREKYITNFNPNQYTEKRNLAIKYAYEQISNENKEYINNLPIYEMTELEGFKILLSHGSPFNVGHDNELDPDLNELNELDSNGNRKYTSAFRLHDEVSKKFDCDISITGHSHKPFNYTKNGTIHINTGAVGMHSDGTAESSFGILTLDKGQYSYQYVPYRYDKTEVVDYYKGTEFYDSCMEWAILLMLSYHDGVNYCYKFIKSLNNKYSKLKATLTEEDIKKIRDDNWEKDFIEFYKTLKPSTQLFAEKNKIIKK